MQAAAGGYAELSSVPAILWDHMDRVNCDRWVVVVVGVQVLGVLVLTVVCIWGPRSWGLGETVLTHAPWNLKPWLLLLAGFHTTARLCWKVSCWPVFILNVARLCWHERTLG